MITVKILCGCGQKYAFDVEPVQGRMPYSVHCPICKAEGTQAANEIIARALPPQPIPASAPAPAPISMAPRPMTPAAGGSGLRIGGTAPAALALKPVEAAEPVETTRQTQASGALAGLVQGGVRAALRGDDDDGTDKWKWWYYVLAGIGIIAYDAWMLYDTHRIKFAGGIFGGMFCIAVGFWVFKRKQTAR